MPRSEAEGGLISLLDLLGSKALRVIGLLAALGLAANMGMLAVPLFNMQIFNRVLPTRDLGNIQSLAVGVLIAILGTAALDFLRGVVQDRLAASISIRLAALVIGAASTRPRSDRIAGVGMSDVRSVRELLASRACMAPFDLAWSPVLLLALAVMHWALAALGIACMFILVLLNILGDILSRGAVLAANKESQLALSDAADAVNAVEAVTGLGLVPQLRSRWLLAQREARSLVRIATLRSRGISAATSTLRAGMTGAMVALGLGLALNGFASSGSMVAANMILARLLMPLSGLAAMRRQWLDGSAAWKRLRSLAVLGQEQYLDHESANLCARINVEGLVFVPAGSDRAVIRNLSFNVEEGDSLAIVGPSSSGKSVLARLLVGMHCASGGGVYLDGINVSSWDRVQLSRHVGFCSQSPTFLEETIAANVARMEAPNWRRIIELSKQVGLHEAICKLPSGYSTKIKPGVLSGGQRQRLALARALYVEPKLLVLDEPTASLDGEGEAEVLRLLESVKRRRVTLIVVTHRPALAAMADRVIVLQKGSIVEHGTAQDVLATLSNRRFKHVRAANDREAAF